MNIYVASSWRNQYQPEVVKKLREDGHDVYDFKDSDGFEWTEVDEDYMEWVNDIPRYLEGLKHKCSIRGFGRDMSALSECDACVYVTPCGVSASLEAGWAVGANKIVVMYVPELREPDLMVKMFDYISPDLDKIRDYLKEPWR